MSRARWSKPFVLSTLAVLVMVSATGCQQDLVYKKSMGELNQKAQAMMNSGDVDGAVSRLEAAHDLDPNEPLTTHNLAIAYQMQGNYDKAIEMFQSLTDKPGLDHAEIYKSLGISYEGKADKLLSQAKELEEDPKADKTKLEKITQLKTESEAAYQSAIDAYQKALPGLKNPVDVEKQIQALETRNQQPDPMAENGGLPQ